MARKKKSDEELEAEIERSLAEATALLESWAGERHRVLLSISAGGIIVEGTLRRLDGQEPRFWFRSLSGDLTRIFILDPPIRVEAGETSTRIRFGFDDDDQRCSLRLSPVQTADPTRLAEAITQLNDWANRKAKVLVEFDFGFAGSGHLCEVETANQEIFGLVECDTSRTYFAIPHLCIHATLERGDGDPSPVVTLRSDDARPALRIMEAHPDSEGIRGFAILSKMVH